MAQAAGRSSASDGGPPRPAPTAVRCGNDVLAFGALLKACMMGLAVPEALAIVGFDDLEMARHIQPALTARHVPIEALWHLVTDRVVAAHDQLPVPAATELEVERVVCESTGPAPADPPAR